MFTTTDALPRALPQVGGAPFSGAFKAIADTGTSLLALPKADLATLIAKLPGVKELPGTGEYLIPDCTKVGGGGGQPPTPPLVSPVGELPQPLVPWMEAAPSPPVIYSNSE